MLDASVVLAFIFGEPRADTVEALLMDMIEPALVPDHWRLEIANAIAMRVQSKKATEEAAMTMLQVAGALNLVADGETWRRSWTQIATLSLRHQLTAYDAAYLELALRRELPLATFDRRLAHAAAAEDTPLIFPEVLP